MDLAFDGSCDLYGITSLGERPSSLYEIDPTAGTGTLVTTSADTCLMGLTIDPADRFLTTDYCVTDPPLYQINTSDGTLTNLGSTGIDAPMGLTYEAAAAPEPTSLALLFPAVAGLELLRRRKKMRVRHVQRVGF
ncbi:MAG: hypothetical protein ACREFY_15835 [Acetobacteraceae bacterium]